MTSKILLRRYADALTTVNVRQALDHGAIGRNSGNLIFTAAAQRLLTTADSDIEMLSDAQFRVDPRRVNDEFDHLVLPLANAFRPGYVKYLHRLTDLIGSLDIPVTILGVGVQADLDYRVPRRAAIDDAVKAFVSAVLDRGPSIGVRGECTAQYLHDLGFHDVEVIGCPSMFFHGESLRISDEPVVFNAHTRIGLNLTPRVPIPDRWISNVLARHPKTMYVAQDSSDLLMMLGGAPLTTGPDFPGHLDHPLLATDRTRVYLNAPVWIDAMKSRDFTFGSRIHGNVAALLAGRPAHVIAHDSRTLELARYFQIPHTASTQITSDTMPADLYERSDWRPTVTGHRERTERMRTFLEAHQLATILSPEHRERPFDERLAQVTIGPEATIGPRSSDPATLEVRAFVSAAERRRRDSEIQAQLEALTQRVETLEADNLALKAELAHVRNRRFGFLSRS